MATYTESNRHFVQLVIDKTAAMHRSPIGFFIAALMGGAFIGIAMLLALTVSAGFPAGARPLINGAVFGLGLMLVTMAGAELFTGTVMYTSFGLFKRGISVGNALMMLLAVWIGNLIGATILTWLFSTAGGGSIFSAPSDYLQGVVSHKEDATPLTLLARSALCNWLVCLALWLNGRLASESARIIAMAWCLLAFVACGFEHSVANMTVFTLAAFDPSLHTTLPGALHNLVWATLGNVIGGGLFVAGGYLLVARTDPPETPAS